ncbi:alpha/beta fold hydrolase [Arthrobacter mobilis]|uniref:Alpha/beta hydrolase n=1 Tax=Arthrobacter mobilis TaxID=2724944 RepID=A0A7X6K4C6_9MICC|nr:alpha/beta fold hydrolase [Arthrobacter mobilis]NKX55192.1 alpha/beta hydrolase [Arthrobacter mobilis]
MSAPLILLHGWACSSAYWAPLARELGQAGRSVLAPDLPGYGGEALDPGADWTVEKVAARLAADLGGTGPAHWIGHSLGGSVAATIAARQPALAASVTLVGMVPLQPSAATQSRLLRLFGGPGPAGPGAAEEIIAAWFRGGPEPAGADRETFLAPFRLPAAVVRASMLAGLTGAAADVPELISAATMVVTGSRDATRTPEAVAGFMARHPHWRHVQIPGAGHMVHWEQPAACAAAILAHTAQAEPAQAGQQGPGPATAGGPGGSPSAPPA